jgi:acyl-coenzyme A thioesterase PaaI-like protein
MSLAEIILQEPNAEALQRWLKKVPYAVFLDIRAHIQDGEILFILPANEKLIGNPSLPALHGGVIGAFMEQAGAFHLIAKMSKPLLPKIIDFSLDYLRAARLQDTYAQCKLTRQGRLIANISIKAWQEDSDKPNAIARAHFLLPETD